MDSKRLRIIDGQNVKHSLGYSKKNFDSARAADRQFATELAEYGKKQKGVEDIVIFFDGNNRDGFKPLIDVACMEVVFTGRSSADDSIVHLVIQRMQNRRCDVVTNDNGLARRVASAKPRRFIMFRSKKTVSPPTVTTVESFAREVGMPHITDAGKGTE